MRTLILIVILQLTVLLIETNGEYQFGDLIAFERLYAHKKEGFYKHYAVYVGDKDFPEKKPEDNIFEFTGTVQEWFKSGFKSPIANCVFKKYDPKSKHSKDNYLDNNKDYHAGNEVDITKRIKEKYRNCGRYDPMENNCEHLATYVRYGTKVSVQHGTQLQGKTINDLDINTEEILATLCQSDNLMCESSASTPSNTPNKGHG